MNEIGRETNIPPEETAELIATYRNGGPEGDAARERLIKSNLRLVVHIAKKFVRDGVSFEDLVFEGNIGLMRSLDTYDVNGGAALSTYACFGIRQRIVRSLSFQRQMVRVPSDTSTKLASLSRIVEILTAKLGRKPTDEEIVEETAMSPEALKRLQDKNAFTVSLESPIGDEQVLGDTLADHAAARPDDCAETAHMRAAVGGLVSQLRDRERSIIEHVFGMNGKNHHTLEEAAQVFGVTRERIRQIKEKALGKLRVLCPTIGIFDASVCD